MRKLTLFAALFFIFAFVSPTTSSAGILIKSSKLRSSVSVRLPRIRVGRAMKSTAISARLNPIGGGQTYGTPDSLKFLSKSQKKYHKRLAKWEKKKIKAEKKLAKKKAKKKKRDAKLRKKRLKEFAKKQEKLRKQKARQQANLKDQRGERAQVEKGGRPSTAKNGVFGKRHSGSKKPRSFWSKFWTALVGRSAIER